MKQNRYKNQNQANKRPKITPEMEEKMKIKSLIEEIRASLDDQEANDNFRKIFTNYKTN